MTKYVYMCTEAAGGHFKAGLSNMRPAASKTL